MSLRMFHIIFVAVSSLLMLYVSGGAYMMWNYYADSSYLSYLAFGVLGLIILGVYSQRFIRKYKNI